MEGEVEAMIKITIKMMDSQTYSLQVNKRMPVPALKEQIASVTGVLTEQQRLICHGKVLKDDQLLSAYHVEDGHTLHLVVRQPVPLASENLHGNTGTSQSQDNHLRDSFVSETFHVPESGNGFLPDLGRIISTVLGSFGVAGEGGRNGRANLGVHGPERAETTIGGLPVSIQLQHEQTGLRNHSDGLENISGMPAFMPLGSLQPPEIHDSLTTLSQYLSNLRHVFNSNVAGTVSGEQNAQAAGMPSSEERESQSASPSSTEQEGLPTPESLAEVLLSTRQLIVEHTSESLSQLAREFGNQATMADPGARMLTQANARRTGVLIQNLGAFLLELGRTTMTLRLGSTPSRAVVNAGPAVFISPTGPNPLMVQPNLFQPGASFGGISSGSGQTGSSLHSGPGTRFLPRRIDIQILRGSSMATNNVNQEVHVGSQQPPGQRTVGTDSASQNRVSETSSGVSEGPSINMGPRIRVVPLRTMVASVPNPIGHQPSVSPGGSLGLYIPVLGRFHPASQASSQDQNSHGSVRNESFVTSDSTQPEQPLSGGFGVDILTGAGSQISQQSEEQFSRGFHFVRIPIPGANAHEVGDMSSEGIVMGSTEHADVNRPNSAGVAQEAAAGVTDEGIFLSNMLHRLMPLISQHSMSEPNVVPQEEAVPPENENAHQASSSQAFRTSRRQSDLLTSSPNSKRRKTE